MNVLNRECRRTGVRYKSDTLITRLILNDDGRACGAMGIDLASGYTVIFRAKAVILAMGMRANSGSIGGERSLCGRWASSSSS